MPTVSQKYQLQHLKNIKRSQEQIRLVYERAMDEIALSVNQVEYNGKLFSLKDYPLLKARVDALVKKMQEPIRVGIVNGINLAWGLSNRKNDDLVDQALADAGHEKEAIYYDPNLQAREAFIRRKTAKIRGQENKVGLDLSARVWNLLDPFKHELEQAIGLGISEGASASRMATQLKQYLNNPDKLFRRVRGEDGKLRLSRAARNYHPGKGVYRSSYKNAMRLSRTEINMAYQESDHQRWKKIDFITGFEVRLSLMHPRFDICDHLVGKYPKEFKFLGWHPQCLCNAVPIMATDQEFRDLRRAVFRGTEKDWQPKNKITELPAGFKEWVKNNAAKYMRQEKQPYWWRDNYELINGLGTPLEILMAQAKEVGPEVDKLATDIAVEFQSTVTPINFKSAESIMRKTIKEYDGNLGLVKDAVRTTIVAPAGQLLNILEKFKNTPGVVKIKRQGFDKTDPLGYTGNIISYKASNGLITEIQVNTADMIFGKEKENDARRILGDAVWERLRKHFDVEGGKGHEYYEVYRKLDQNDPTTLAERAKIEKESSDYYNFLKVRGLGSQKEITENDLRLLGLVKSKPRLDNENDKDYAKRVIDKLIGEIIVRENPGMYFDFGGKEPTLVRVDLLSPYKDVEETVQSGANALRRLWGASMGILSKRGPISVTKLQDGTFKVMDGNSTYTAAKGLNWDRLPVRILTKHELVEAFEFTSAQIVQVAKLPEDKLIYEELIKIKKGKQPKPKRIPKEDNDLDKLTDEYFSEAAITAIVKGIKNTDPIKNTTDDHGPYIGPLDLPENVKTKLSHWLSSSNRIRTLQETDPAKKFFLRGVTKETTFSELYRGEGYDKEGRDKSEIFEKVLEIFKPGAEIDFSKKLNISTNERQFLFDQRLVSYSSKQRVAEEFGRLEYSDYNSVIFKLIPAEGKTLRGFDLHKVSLPGENEVVIGDSYKYKVVKVENIENKPGNVMITLLQVLK